MYNVALTSVDATRQCIEDAGLLTNEKTGNGK